MQHSEYRVIRRTFHGTRYLILPMHACRNLKSLGWQSWVRNASTGRYIEDSSGGIRDETYAEALARGVRDAKSDADCDHHWHGFLSHS